jgi:hypothetical protein
MDSALPFIALEKASLLRAAFAVHSGVFVGEIDTIPASPSRQLDHSEICHQLRAFRSKCSTDQRYMQERFHVRNAQGQRFHPQILLRPDAEGVFDQPR